MRVDGDGVQAVAGEEQQAAALPVWPWTCRSLTALMMVRGQLVELVAGVVDDEVAALEQPAQAALGQLHVVEVPSVTTSIW